MPRRRRPAITANTSPEDQSWSKYATSFVWDSTKKNGGWTAWGVAGAALDVGMLGFAAITAIPSGGTSLGAAAAGIAARRAAWYGAKKTVEVATGQVAKKILPKTVSKNMHKNAIKKGFQKRANKEALTAKNTDKVKSGEGLQQAASDVLPTHSKIFKGRELRGMAETAVRYSQKNMLRRHWGKAMIGGLAADQYFTGGQLRDNAIWAGTLGNFDGAKDMALYGISNVPIIGSMFADSADPSTLNSEKVPPANVLSEKSSLTDNYNLIGGLLDKGVNLATDWGINPDLAKAGLALASFGLLNGILGHVADSSGIGQTPIIGGILRNILPFAIAGGVIYAALNGSQTPALMREDGPMKKTSDFMTEPYREIWNGKDDGPISNTSRLHNFELR